MNKINYRKPKIKIASIKTNFFNWKRRFMDSNSSLDGLLETGVLLASGCFIAGTKVLGLNNKRINIEKIKEGDRIISYNNRTNQYIENKVMNLLIHKNDRSGYLIINKVLKVTPNHRLLANRAEWKRADELRIGDNLLLTGNKPMIIKSIELIESTNTVYNLHLKRSPHNFFAEGILVHNGPSEVRKS